MTFLPGQSGNPGGSGTRKIFRDAINMEMLMHERGELDPVPRASARGLIRAQIMKAADGDLAALAFLCERAEGKASVQIGGRSGRSSSRYRVAKMLPPASPHSWQRSAGAASRSLRLLRSRMTRRSRHCDTYFLELLLNPTYA